jgi:hypothetical protein
LSLLVAVIFRLPLFVALSARERRRRGGEGMVGDGKFPNEIARNGNGSFVDGLSNVVYLYK